MSVPPTLLRRVMSLRVRTSFALCLSLLAAGACHPRVNQGPIGADAPSPASIHADIAYLASDRLQGRGTGTAGNDSAAAYVAARFAKLKLRPFYQDFRQPFVARSLAAAHSGRPSELPTQNVVALLPGSDPALRGQYVVVGAHFDHLGRSPDGALDPEARDAIRNGADDNASGTAAVLELARLLSAAPPRRSVIFIAFSGEELGLFGSQYFVEHSPIPVDSITAMVNFDMVGRLRENKLIVYGVATATELPALLDSANAQTAGAHQRWSTPLRITALGDGFGPSDHSSFYAKNIPVLHFFTDLHEDYHRASDDVEKIDVEGEAHVVAVAERVVRSIADRSDRLTFVRGAPARVAVSGREGSNVYLGSIPDMSTPEGSGLRLMGVSPGSPAEQAGLRAGDLIVEFAGHPVKDLYEYSDALYAQKPGDDVAIVIVRNGERKTVTVKLGKRG